MPAQLSNGNVMMSRDPASLGLSEVQAGELMRLRNEYQSRIGYAPTDSAAWFGNQLSTYLTSLCIDAAIENHAYTSRPTTYLRKKILSEYEDYLGRTPTAGDMLHELARHVPVPEFVAEVLRRDVERLLL
jgi:hypothetical protein